MPRSHVRGGPRVNHTIDPTEDHYEEKSSLKVSGESPEGVPSETTPQSPWTRAPSTSRSSTPDSISVFEDAQERFPASGSSAGLGSPQSLGGCTGSLAAEQAGMVDVITLSDSEQSDTPLLMDWTSEAPEGSIRSETPASVVLSTRSLSIRPKSSQGPETPELPLETPISPASCVEELPPSTPSVELPKTTLLAPRSSYEPFRPGMNIVFESEAVDHLLTLLHKEDGDDFHELQLDDFAIYSDNDKSGIEMRPLHQLDTRPYGSHFLFSGVLSAVGAFGEECRFVKDVPIGALPIGNYTDLSEHSVHGDIWIQSLDNEDLKVYYKLGRPAMEYKRFFEPFVWVADLAKHFVDYMKHMAEDGQKISIHHFRSDFSQWMQSVHGQAPVFVQWLVKHTGLDFRTSIVANLPFLYKEAAGVLQQRELLNHPLWNEIQTFQQYPAPPSKLRKGEIAPTVVTPYVQHCFAKLPFANLLQVLPFSAETQHLRDSLIQARRLELPHQPQLGSKNFGITTQERIMAIKPGDTISTERDAEGTGTKWKNEEVDNYKYPDRWFALVQKVNRKAGRTFYDVIWYYRPIDTLCGLMKYPWNNELFLSDHCSCGERSKIEESEVVEVHDVDFGGSEETIKDVFCRQMYMHEERKWVALEPKHRWCNHVRPRQEAPEYVEGDTVLVHLDPVSNTSEPCEVISFIQPEGRKSHLRYSLRQLLRRRDVDGSALDAPVNELVYPTPSSLLDPELDDGGSTITVGENSILDRCTVRCFDRGEPIPPPYNRCGVGALFYITHQRLPNGSIVPLDGPPPSLKQGFDPSKNIPRLPGMDLFCGGGNFGRGLEDGGGVQMHWANDYDTKALHTYMANVDPQKVAVHPFPGSVDVLQRLAIEGQFSQSVPRMGEVDFISAGSPCPGFSVLTNNKTTPEQRKNQSLVASFASFVDLYRPRYGLLENVPGIVQTKANRKEDVFSQLICTLVGLGYQTQVYFLDAWSCGSPQNRSRIFVVFAAPGCRLPRKPVQTHSYPPGTRMSGVGRLPTDEAMVRRQMAVATPFKFVTAQEATKDLPWIGDSKADACISHPDHRLSIGLSKIARLRIQLIPTIPFGMKFATTWYGTDTSGAKIEYLPGRSVMTKSERRFFPGWEEEEEGDKPIQSMMPKSNAYGRVYPNRPFGTIVTRSTINDSKSGRHIHWKENRVLSVMEVRRAQGFRDDEVILGIPSDQYRIVGNSVAREVSVAVGLVLREAWEGTMRDQGMVSEVEAFEMTDEDLKEEEVFGCSAHGTPAAAGTIVVDSVDASEDAGDFSTVSPGHTPMTSDSDLEEEVKTASKRPGVFADERPTKTSRTRTKGHIDAGVNRTGFTTTEYTSSSTRVKIEPSASASKSSKAKSTTIKPSLLRKELEVIVLD